MLPSAYGLGAWNRTTDLLRVTQVFCQLNYAKMKWSERVESNHQPHRYQRCALAVELRSGVLTTNFILLITIDANEFLHVFW